MFSLPSSPSTPPWPLYLTTTHPENASLERPLHLFLSLLLRELQAEVSWATEGRTGRPRTKQSWGKGRTAVSAMGFHFCSPAKSQNKQTNKCRLIERSRLQVINNCSFFFPTLNRTWRSLPRQISYLGLGGSPSSIFLRKTYKAQFLAASPGHCPGPLAASSHHAKSIPGSRRSGRIMRSLRELPTWQQPFHQKSPCCNQRRSFLFILRELTGKWSGPNFVQKMGATNEVLPLAFFFLFYSAQETYIFLQLFIQGWQSPQSGILKRWQKTRYASPVLSPFPHSFQIFFPFQGQKSLLMFWIKCLDI